MGSDPRSLEEALTEAFGNVVRDQLDKQAWWRRSSNTVVGAIGGVVQLAWWIIGLDIDLPKPVVYGVGAVILVGQVLGLKKTPNGITPGVADQIQRDVTEYVVQSTGRHARRDG
jgi:hypothetical protein